MNINATIIGQTITFVLLVWFTMRFVWPPLMRAMDERTKRIADGLAAAERGKHELELAGRRSTEVLRDAKQQAAEIVANAERLAAQLVEEAKSAAKSEGERLLSGAKSQIEQEVFRAKESLRQQVAALAVAGAEKILRREVDPKAHADILAQIEKDL
ncbi:MAG: F0F1 ATP synthase subunit B [Pseudomonadota bacterium]